MRVFASSMQRFFSSGWLFIFYCSVIVLWSSSSHDDGHTVEAFQPLTSSSAFSGTGFSTIRARDSTAVRSLRNSSSRPSSSRQLFSSRGLLLGQSKLHSAAAAAADAGDASSDPQQQQEEAKDGAYGGGVIVFDDGDGEEEGEGESGGTATIPAHVFNLVKGIVGAGVLTLPAGIATFGNAPSAALPAVLLIIAIGTMSGYGFALIGRVCALTNTGSYRGAWEQSVSPKTSGYVATAVTMKTIFAILAYSMILGDTFQALAFSAGFTTVSKAVTLASVTTFLLLPLCLLKNLSSLAPFSLLGTLGMVYTAVAMAVRYFGGAYVAPGGAFATDLPAVLRPAFGSIGAKGVLSAKTAILLGMLSTSYMAHFNAPKFYTELKNNTVPRFLKVVSTSFGISIGLFCIIAALGFLTFGGNSAGLILNKCVQL